MKPIETPANEPIDLGAASAETRGQSKYMAPDSTEVQLRDQPGLAAD